MRWLKKESETRKATILYATHIFDGLDDWPTHLHYLCNKGHTGWQGRIENLELYQQLRSKVHITPPFRTCNEYYCVSQSKCSTLSYALCRIYVPYYENTIPLTFA